MTDVTYGTTTVTRHIWSVPCKSKEHSAVIGDLRYAETVAERKLTELGRSTSTDNAYYVQPFGDYIQVWFDEDKRDQRAPRADRISDFEDWLVSDAPSADEEVALRLIREYKKLRGL